MTEPVTYACIEGCGASGRTTTSSPEQTPGNTTEPSDVLSSVLLSHGLRRSTIDAGGLNYRVRNGTGCTPSAITTEHI
jgi:hypothetical protein